MKELHTFRKFLAEGEDAKMVTFKNVGNSDDEVAAIERVATALGDAFDEYTGKNSIKLNPGKSKDTVKTIVNNVLKKRGLDDTLKFSVK